VEVCTKIPSGRNQQVLRFKLLTRGEGSEKMQGLYKLGAALPELHLPFAGTEPEAFIILCSTVTPDKWVHMDVGIAAQSMLLKAVEMGLGGIFILNFRLEALKEALGLPLEPVAVIGLGKPAETIFLVPGASPDALSYYRKDGVHYVPKLAVDALII
jgi:nitroreductase